MFCTKCGSEVTGNFCRSCGAPAGQSPAAPPGQGYATVPAGTPAGLTPTPVSLDYALWSTRVFGYLIDMLFTGAVVLLLLLAGGLVFGSVLGLGTGLIRPGVALPVEGAGCCIFFALFPFSSLLVGLYNKVYLVAWRGASVGQGVMHLRVVDASGRLLTQGAALVRLLAHVGISLVPFGGIIDLLWPLWDPQRQTLHDKAVGCYVINYRGA